MYLLLLVLEFLGETVGLALETLSFRFVNDGVSESASAGVTVSALHLSLLLF